ncbi:MAG: DUF1592 domain-containing protein [Planctomycetota bacterium]
MALALLLLTLAPAFSGDEERAMLTRFCGECHAGAEPKGGFALGDLAFVEDEALWWRVAQRIEDGSMPPDVLPETVPPLDSATKTRLLAWLEREHPRPVLDLSQLPGPPVRRYNRTELVNAVRELFGVAIDREALMPDEIGDGFDTHAGALVWNELSFERWLDVVERLAHEVIRPLDELEHARRPVASDAWAQDGRLINVSPNGVSMATSATVTAVVSVPAASRYRIEVEARASRGGDELAKAVVLVDGRVVETFEVDAVSTLTTYSVEVELDAGTAKVGVRFPNDFYDGTNDRNLYLGEVALVGPLDEPILSAFQARYLAKPDVDARAVVRDFASRLWRRPVGDADVDALLALTEPSTPVELRVRAALVAALASPRFVFLGLEADEFPEHALAERLAAFLWKSPPDDELLELAASGRLSEPEVLRAQVARLLDAAQSSAFAADFASQWLQLRALDDAMPDARRFPGYDAELGRSMVRESELFFEAVLREHRPIRTLLEADFSFLDARLAEHYGVPGAFAADFRRTRLTPERRAGVLGHASVLTVTSNPTRTSPVLRGKWILEALLDEPPPPPPPDAANLAAIAAGDAPQTLRARLEAHRDHPDCAACHAAMDPLGFALEEFDAVGAWRTSDGGLPIDAVGVLPSGELFDGARELASTLVDGDRFRAALTRRLAVYALGRSLVPEDDLWLEPLGSDMRACDTTLPELIHAIVASPAFRHDR